MSLNSGVIELLDTCKHFRIPTAAYRQLGAGGPLRMIPDPSQSLIFDAFGRDEDLPDRRTTDKLGVHLDAAEVASTQDTPIAALPPLLSIIQTSEELGLWNILRQCSVKLSHVLTQIDREVQVNFAHPTQTGANKAGGSCLISIAMKEVEGLWDKILASEDDELIFSGAHVLGSANLKRQPDAAMEFAKLALTHALNLGHQQKIGLSAKILSIAFHNTGRRKQRDIVAAFWLQVQKAKGVEDWHQSAPHNALLTEVFSDPSAMNRLSASAIWKHELRALGQSVGLLPEIIARVGVAVASSQANI
ncbi:hypothetical protein QFC21_000207 [Naganishia friedmannii]|uniref:Uncharacterized protein n=1 Tax=Naganishia friedmannii TaxID=89922 RepID=A0ACC2WCV3_9TREE|nr:hypothetical protein QFC21_000207 [Naganishia friedmannii]